MATPSGSGTPETGGTPKTGGTPTTGGTPFTFIHRPDLHVLPGAALEHETKLHGGFAADRRAGFGHLYYGMPGSGILRVDPDLRRQELISLPVELQPLNFHSTQLGQLDGEWRLFLPANDDALVAVVSLDGRLDFTLSRPEFEQYQRQGVIFAPTGTALVDGELYVADGYGANHILRADLRQHRWSGLWGGKTDNANEQGRFGTAHSIAVHPRHAHQLVIADRPHARIQVHGLEGDFIASHKLPAGSWPCGTDFFEWQGRTLVVIGSLFDPIKDRPAPVYIADAGSFEVLATLRPKEDLGIEAAQHLHNVVAHVHGERLFLVCQSWNPGSYFVLEWVSGG